MSGAAQARAQLSTVLKHIGVELPSGDAGAGDASGAGTALEGMQQQHHHHQHHGSAMRVNALCAVCEALAPSAQVRRCL